MWVLPGSFGPLFDSTLTGACHWQVTVLTDPEELHWCTLLFTERFVSGDLGSITSNAPVYL